MIEELAMTENLHDKLITHRRALHQIAESGFNEWQTLNYLVRHTQNLEGATLSFIDTTQAQKISLKGGIKLSDYLPQEEVKHFVLGKEIVIPSLCVRFNLQEQGKVIAIRSDMDALPIVEDQSSDHLPKILGFVSATSCTHACAHDGHMAIALSLCEMVPLVKDDLIKNGVKELRVIFQSAEEGCQGARFLALSSFMDNIDEIYCYHLGMGLPSGLIAPKVDKFLPTLKFDVSFLGKKAHAGKPQNGVNAVKALADFISKSLDLMEIDSGRLINFSNLQAPGARNIIPDFAAAEGELRSLSQAQLKAFEMQINDLLDGIKKETPSLLYNFKVVGFATEIKSDAELIAKVKQAALDASLQVTPNFDFNASEDASLLIDKVQDSGGLGIYFVIGSNLKNGHHHSAFDFDEQSLDQGLSLILKLLVNNKN